MKLYYFETLNPRKACAVAKHLGSPVEFVRIDLAKGEHKTPEYLAINPNGKVPTLSRGGMHLWEADAIMAYLAREARSDLFPSDERQIDVMRWLSWGAQHFTRHASTLYFENIVKPRFLKAAPDPKAIEEATGFFNQFAQVLNDHLRGRKYLLGDALTIADFSVAVVLPGAEQANLSVSAFPEIERWHARLNELPAWREPFPSPKAAAA
ncbi:MAG: glutathione S-transferase family protein [Hyphomonadaceae bacterium]|jgi:glutathione S-transferase|nr:glutathione S-transferase family protein [Hyphomonadaceae bacterium]